MKSSEKPLECPTIPDGLVDWLEEMFPPHTNSLHHDLRELDFRSGQVDIIEQLRHRYDRQRNNHGR